METVSINTSQNVRISYTVASLSDRIFAFLVDFMIIISTTILLVVIASATGGLQASPIVISVVAVLPMFFYHVVLEITMNGQSIGKKVLNTKVVKLNGSQASLGAYLLRWIFRPIDIFLYGGVAILCITVGGKGQRLGDIVAGTTVIKLKKSVFLKEHTLSQPDENYTPIFLNADILEPEYIVLIQQAIKAKLEMLDDKPVTAIAAKTKQKLGISTTLPDLKFLHTIVKDYYKLKLNE